MTEGRRTKQANKTKTTTTKTCAREKQEDEFIHYPGTYYLPN
jgi:hypothetical protein